MTAQVSVGMREQPLAGLPAGDESRAYRPLFVLSLLTAGAMMALAGLALRGSTWILPDGLLAGGVALMVVTPFARNALDVIVVLSPFMCLMRAPVGGVLNAGTSDVLLPFVVGGMVLAALLGGVAAARSPRVRPAVPFLLVAALLVLGSTTAWTVADPEFILKRAVVDAAKVGIGVTYLIVVYLLARSVGKEAVLHSFRLWAWTATALSMGALVGITGVVQIIPTDGYRSNGYFEDPNLHAGYLLVSLSIVLFLGAMGDLAWLPVQGLAIVGGVLMTGSRGGVASLVLLLALALVIINSARIRAMILGLVTVFAAGIAYLFSLGTAAPSILGINRLVGASDDVADDPRLQLWGVAIDKWLDHPVAGIGLGQFERFSASVGGTLKSTGVGYVTHNTFLFFLVALGIPGLLLFLSLLGWLVVRLYGSALPRQAKHALLSGILVLCSQFMTLNLQNLRYVWVYFGLVLALSVLHESDAAEESAGPSPRLR